MKWIRNTLIGLVVLVALVWIFGALLSREHVASCRARFTQSPDEVWKAITDVEGLASWRKELSAVKRLPDGNGFPGYVETSSFGDMPLRVIESVPPKRMVTRIDEEELPFGGTWTFEIEPIADGATLRLTENGHVKPAFFRFVSRFVFGHTSNMEQYLNSLGTKFGSSVTIEQG